ncbi:MAG: hypothetical protein K2G41_06915 [Duncaniella sp.]|uniref:hypothetical protein n=1 Tax=Duncaniella sp. TaxID=2518496 RepID=UPI0019B6833C|nr:hypothetical protein [Duncaniella sp.]MBD5313598.1 hypothetical protein [Bacteroides sp.]MBD5334849.1 hypothetical protein [Bacteroides sp.]MDE6090416.1 hypothetical protein [Duncaniella sp.]
MVTRQIIDKMYKQYKRPPASPDELNFGLLFAYAIENHGIVIDENDLYIGSIDPRSPFATIPLRHIHEIVEFENYLAIILRNSIIFLHKTTSDVNVHLRMDEPSVWSRLKDSLSSKRVAAN